MVSFNNRESYYRIVMVIIIMFLSAFLPSKYGHTEQPVEDLDKKADSLSREGEMLLKGCHYEEAINRFKQAIGMYRDLGKLEGVYSMCCDLGTAYYFLSEYDSALVYSHSALTVTREMNDKKEETSSLNNIGTVYDEISLSDRALAYYDSALTIARAIKDREEEARSLNNKGRVYDHLNQYNKALAYYDSGYVINKEIGNRSGITSAFNNIGYIYKFLGQYDRALAYYDSSLRMKREIEDVYGEAIVLSNIGVVYNVLSQYERALMYHDSALSINRKIMNRQGEAISLNSIAAVYRFLGQYENALKYLNSALVIARAIKDRLHEATVLNNIGAICHFLGQHERTLAYSDSALIVSRAIKDRNAEGVAFNNAGDVYHSLGRFEKSLAYYDSALGIAREIGDRRGKGIALLKIGNVNADTDCHDKAFACYDSALQIMEAIGGEKYKGMILERIGYLYEKMNSVEKAVEYYRNAIEIKEAIRSQIEREQLKTSYIEIERDVYERLAALLIRLERYEEAFDYLERSRSEKLRSSYEQSDITAHDPSLRRTLERINFIETEMEVLRKKLRSREIGEQDFENRIIELEGVLNEKLIDLKTHHEQLYNTMMPQRRTLKYIQETIPDNTVFLEYTDYADKYLVFLFTKKTFLTKALEGRKETIDNLVNEAVTAVKTQAPLADAQDIFDTLYTLLIKPVEDILEEYANIVIIPYGQLHYLPFHCLGRVNEEGTYEYFIQHKRISYLPTASFLTDLFEKKTRAQKELLAFGNADGTLPNAEIEVTAIAELFPKALVLTTTNACKERFVELCGEYQYIHLATHSFLNGDPRYSYVVLAPGGTGNITVREIYGLSGRFKSTSLVTLSACETAIEKDPQNACMELTTLSNAFKVAGVPSTIATLWEIADFSTSVLMKNFYENIKKGKMDKLEALRQAQLSMMQQVQYSHPYYWAPFVLIGDWR